MLVAERYPRINPRTLEHSGQVFCMQGRTASGTPIWPVEEWLARHPVTPRMRRRLLKLNPIGQPEGCHPRGLNYKLTVRDIEVRSDLQSLMHFCRRFELDPRKIAAEAKRIGGLYKHGRRKFITGVAAMSLEVNHADTVRPYQLPVLRQPRSRKIPH